MTDNFDMASLLEAMTNWPSIPISNRKAADPILDRIRQVLARLQARPHASCKMDLVPLLRQVSLRNAASLDAGVRMRVPAVQGWPSAVQWREDGFEVQDNGAWLVIRARSPRLAFLGLQADLLDEVFGEVYARNDMRVDADPVFKRLMELPTYTGLGQREAVRALVQLPPGETLIANLPTGSGKSVLAQLPPLIADPGRLTVAIVPTVALAIDQAERMRAILLARDPHGSLPPLAYHGGLDEDRREEVRKAIRDGQQRILFLSPEHATSTLRGSIEEAARVGRISHVVVDEAHLVIGWGNGFRPAFQLLPALVRNLQRIAPASTLRLVLASATLTSATIEALKDLFSAGQRIHLAAGVYLRPEPRYAFSRSESEPVRLQRILEVVRFAPRPLILYVTRPDEADRWASQLREAGFSRLATFTGKTGALDREKLLSQWRGNELDVMVATSAFGLGVDKGDVRTIIHATLPESLDRYYQEVGRSGRDGHASASVLVFTDDDMRQARRMATSKVAREGTAFERWRLMIQHAQRDPQQPNMYWLNLGLLPARLVQNSEASAEWNVKTLTLMARANMLELVALTQTRSDDGSQELAMEDARFAAVRLLNDNLREEGAFHSALALGRARIREAGQAGYRALLSVVTGRVEIAQALQQTYSIVGNGVWSPVAQYCGGCPRHWGSDRWSGRPVAPVVPRLDHFGVRDHYKKWLSRWPLASDNLLVIAVPSDTRHTSQCHLVLRVLIHALQPHTLVLGPGIGAGLEPTHLLESGQPPVNWPFVEDLGANRTAGLVAGENEVRLTVWGLGTKAQIPDALWTSSAALELLVIPDNMVHPLHPGRRLIDTTPYIHVEEIVNNLST
jgi:ATP-dependent DNA helicase RecQ